MSTATSSSSIARVIAFVQEKFGPGTMFSLSTGRDYFDNQSADDVIERINRGVRWYPEWTGAERRSMPTGMMFARIGSDSLRREATAEETATYEGVYGKHIDGVMSRPPRCR